MIEWLTGISTIIIAIATFVYATLTYFLLREQQREKKKPIIEEMLKTVIYPLLKNVQNEIQSLKQRKFKWYHKTRAMWSPYSELESFKDGAEKLVYENFSKAYPNIAGKLNFHDIELAQLRDKIEKLGNKLLVAGFKEKCMELMNQYNEHSIRKISEPDIDYLLQDVIDNTKILDKSHITSEFWNSYSEELLKFREMKGVKEYIESVDVKAKQLLKTCEQLESELKRLINKFRDKYGVAISELEIYHDSKGQIVF